MNRISKVDNIKQLNINSEKKILRNSSSTNKDANQCLINARSATNSSTGYQSPQYSVDNGISSHFQLKQTFTTR